MGITSTRIGIAFRGKLRWFLVLFRTLEDSKPDFLRFCIQIGSFSLASSITHLSQDKLLSSSKPCPENYCEACPCCSQGMQTTRKPLVTLLASARQCQPEANVPASECGKQTCFGLWHSLYSMLPSCTSSLISHIYNMF